MSVSLHSTPSFSRRSICPPGSALCAAAHTEPCLLRHIPSAPLHSVYLFEEVPFLRTIICTQPVRKPDSIQELFRRGAECSLIRWAALVYLVQPLPHLVRHVQYLPAYCEPDHETQLNGLIQMQGGEYVSHYIFSPSLLLH